MSYGFLDIMATSGVKAAQAANGSREMWEGLSQDRTFDRFTENETAFIAARDTFYMASVSESGWPYIQHRGGPAGFLKLLDDKTLGFADFRGNRQYISLGNIAVDDRVALILVDYPHRARLKILGHMSTRDLKSEPKLAEQLVVPGYKARPERAFVLKLEAFDWNCPQHITSRFTQGEVEAAVLPLQQRLAALEAENDVLRRQIAGNSNQERPHNE
ncbi:MAG TPA: pyridoxamine 5'-phosphate oxidase family protein [Acidiphilium sp.]|nr:pyridoxamine 5'-phosphate oxidase family protein [Acidiphilium sp.]